MHHPPSRAALLFAALLVCPLVPARAQQPVTTRSLPSTEADAILGRDVVGSAGEDVGPLVDVLVDKNGVPLAGVIDVGGFLGVGTRRVAVAWHLLSFEHVDDETVIHMSMTFDSAAAAPEYQGPDNTIIVIDRTQP